MAAGALPQPYSTLVNNSGYAANMKGNSSFFYYYFVLYFILLYFFLNLFFN